MFTWSKLYKSVPYESAVKGLSVDTTGEKPEFCDNETNKQPEEPLRPDEQETSNGR
jgi:hypothetical protein